MFKTNLSKSGNKHKNSARVDTFLFGRPWWKAGTSQNRKYSGGTFRGVSPISLAFGTAMETIKLSPREKWRGLSSAPLKQRLPSSHPRRPHTLSRRGNPKTRGRSPRVVFVCPSPTRVGAAEDEVMGGDDLLGLRDCPRLPDSLPRRYLHHLLFFG